MTRPSSGALPIALGDHFGNGINGFADKNRRHQPEIVAAEIADRLMAEIALAHSGDCRDWVKQLLTTMHPNSDFTA